VESLLHDIIQLLISVGPWIVLLVAATETALFIGLLVPAEATVLVAAFMANAGYFDLRQVLLATLIGGLAGDQIGYVLGRTAGRSVTARGGRLGRLWRQHEVRASVLFRQRALLAVTLARFISFVRTLMPWFAGMSRMPYGRFLFYDVLGVLGWGIGSVFAGYMAGRSWHVLASALGTASAVIILTAVLLLAGLAWRGRRRMRALVRIALTGNIASGKSTVADTWRDLGAVIIDADELARRAVEPGTDALRQIARVFGPGVLRSDGQLDRAALRAVVFEDELKRQQLEAIIHPEVERLRVQEERAAVARGATIVVHMIPLLFETGLDTRFDTIVLVDAPEALRRERLTRLRELTPAEADAMLAAQMPAEQKRERAAWTIDNDEDMQTLRERAVDVWAEIGVSLE
jgi:dephospho-CoA kinase